MIVSRITLTCAVLSLAAFARAEAEWPEFRGPQKQGHADATTLPLKWSETENVRWKTPIPGQGWSSPVISGNQIWLTTAVDIPPAVAKGKGLISGIRNAMATTAQSLRAVCIDRESGKIVHDVEIFSVADPAHKNSFNSYASPTPVLDGGRVFVCFGAYGSAALDAATGEIVWKNTDLKIDHMEGPGSSPIIYKHLFILHCDGADTQYVAALNKDSGELVWKTSRTTDFGMKLGPMRKAFCIPLIISIDGRDQLISPGAFRLFSYEPLSGKEIWSVATPGYSTVPRPVYGEGLLFICTGYNTAELFAVRPEGSGDVTGKNIAWISRQGIPLKPSLLLVEDRLYFTSDTGVARCLDAKSGTQVWTHRLEGNFTASPIYAAGRLYFFSESGVAYVLEPSAKFELLAENTLDGRFMASPAVAGNALFLRTDKALYRIEQ